MKRSGFALAMAMAAAPLPVGAAGPSAATATTAATLLDRIQIEDLITSYYYHLGSADAEAFGDYYTPDAVFDVNGVIGRGRDGIASIYRQLAGPDSPTRGGTFHMLLSNPLIHVSGDRATAEFLWTGIINTDIKGPPRFVEQGREYDTLTRTAAGWRITKRVVIADSGLPAMFEKTYTPRKDYDPDKDR